MQYTLQALAWAVAQRAYRVSLVAEAEGGGLKGTQGALTSIHSQFAR